MLTALREGQARTARKIVAVNPLPEAGLIAVQEPAERRAACSGSGTAARRRCSCQIRVSGDLALFQGLVQALLEADDAAPARCSTATSSPTHTDGLRGVRRATCAASTGTTIVDATGLDREPDRAAARDARRRPSASIVCWAMGLTQHQHARRHHPGDRQPAAAARQHRQARRRRLPGARPHQRAGRPHDGHLGADARRRSSTRSTREFGFDPPARARLRHRRRDPGDARRQAPRCSSRWAATSSRPRPTPTSPRRRCAAAR